MDDTQKRDLYVAHQAIKNCAGSVIHTFNNRLMPAYGHLSIALLRREPPKEIVKELLNIVSSLDKLTEQVKGYGPFTDFSIDPVESFSIETLTELSSLIPDQSPEEFLHRLDTNSSSQTDRKRYECTGYKKRLKNSLYELVLNSMEYTEGKVRISLADKRPQNTILMPQECIGTNLADTDQGFISLSVSDEGKITDEEIYHCMLPGNRGNGLNRDAARGFGLSRVYLTMCNMGGGFDLKNSLKGTTATLYIPKTIKPNTKTS